MHRRSLPLLTAWNKRQDSAWQTPCPFTMQCAMSWLLAQLTSSFVVPTTCSFMRDSLDSIVEPVLDEMGRFYDWTEVEKAAYRADVEAALANNDLAELKN